MESEISNEKIPLVFVINITNYVKLCVEISFILYGDFNATEKNNKIKINVETIDYFRKVTKFTEEKKYEYFTYRFKSEKDISAIIRNLPMPIIQKRNLRRTKKPKLSSKVSNKTNK